jgi:hypothetical protein
MVLIINLSFKGNGRDTQVKVFKDIFEKNLIKTENHPTLIQAPSGLHQKIKQIY